MSADKTTLALQKVSYHYLLGALLSLLTMLPLNSADGELLLLLGIHLSTMTKLTLDLADCESLPFLSSSLTKYVLGCEESESLLFMAPADTNCGSAESELLLPMATLKSADKPTLGSAASELLLSLVPCQAC